MFLCGKGFGTLISSASQFGFGIGEGTQRLFPVGFQAAGHRAGCPGRRPGNDVGFGCLVAGPFHLAAPLRERGVHAGLELFGRGQVGLQPGRGERGQNAAADGGVDADTADAIP